MAIQSKTVAELKSEVLQASSRPYELIEYDADKIFTGQINPDLINSDITTYERSLAGTVIIDKNKDNLLNQKMLISLNTTKISNAKFNEIIDTEFQDFPAAADTSLLFLEGKLAMLESKATKSSFDKSLLQAEIDSLKEEIEKYKELIATITAPLINNIPDSIPYGIELNSDIDSGIGSMILSKNRKARAKFALDESFYITLGNYDVDGRLIDGEEKSTFITPFTGNISTQVLTDAEAAQYLINNPDLEPYFRLPTVEAQTIRDRINNTDYLSVTIPTEFHDDTMRVPIRSYPTIDQKKAALNEYILIRASALISLGAESFYDFRDGKVQRLEQAGEDLDPTWSDKNIPAQIEKIRYRIDGFNWWKQNDPDTNKYDYWLKAYQAVLSKIIELDKRAPGWWNTDNIYPGTLISNNIEKYTTNYVNVQNQLQILRKQLVVNIMNFQSINSTYTIPYNTNVAIPIDFLISSADRDVLKMTNLLTFSPTGNIIESAKGHWKYVVNQSQSELINRFYLSDDQARAYLNNYTDLQEAFGDDLRQAKQHWNFNGINEGRTFAAGNTILRIWRNSSDKKGYIELVKTNPWHVRWTSEYTDLSKSSRMFLDDNGILYLYDKEKIVWQSYNEDAA